MILSQLVKHCDKKYTQGGQCSDCERDCQETCEKCLDAIHFNKTSRNYDCLNMTYCYVCKYVYRYSSEIDRLFARLKSLRKFKSYNILSIGCGPCTELIGVLRFLERSSRDTPVRFYGFDNNSIWKPIHHRITTLIDKSEHDIKARFSYKDALDMIKKLDLGKHTWRPNLIILQYVISDMVKNKLDVARFFRDIKKEIVPYMPKNSYIIINDINHYSVRNHFEKLASLISKKHDTWVFRGHFDHNYRNAYDYGLKHTTNKLTSKIPDEIDDNFNPWNFCSSAQMVIKKKDK